MSKLVAYSVRELKENRGQPRLWLQCKSLEKAGFTPGTNYEVEIDPATQKLTLTASKLGQHVVSSKLKGENRQAVIDLNSNALLGSFGSAVRVIYELGRIWVLPLASVANASARLARLKTKLVAGAALSVAGLAFGGGVLDHAVHAGMQDAGIQCQTTVANEIDGDLLGHASNVNDALAADAILAAAPMQEVAQDAWLMQRLPKVDVCIAGLPCSGASRAGKSKLSLEMMEAHPQVGSLVAPFLAIVNQMQPAIVVVENVPQYAQTASAEIMRSQFRDMGYSVSEVVLDASHFGCLEGRVRWAMVAATAGIAISLDDLAPPVRSVKAVRDVLENVPANSERWKTFGYLKAKEVRDVAKGNGFGMQIVSPEDSRVPTLRKGYHKGGSTDPLLRHPTDPELLRKFTGTEHARIKQVPPHLVVDLSETDQHILLGQAIAYEPFRALGFRIAQALTAFRLQSAPAELSHPAYSLERAVG